ncbi:MAG: hypothetical protein OXG44_09145 [Gammaproteobacteria bacterium]|nr:hypothetical protein [Gammaproteobacteria bacterium]
MTLTIAGLAVGIAGLGFAALMYWHPPKRTRLAYQTAIGRYFEQSDYALPSEAAMTFQGRKVERLSKATIVVWNRGTEVLRGADIVAADPIRLSIVDGRILSHRVIKATDAANDFQLEPVADAGQELVIHYDYLNPGDGAVVELMHDGTGTSVVGKARGLKGEPENCGRIVPGSAATFVRYFRLALSLGGPIVTMALVWGLVLTPESRSDIEMILVFLTLTVCFAVASFGDVASIWRRRRRHPKSLSP